MDAELARLLDRAFSAYIDVRRNGSLQPDVSYLAYDFEHWNIPSVGGHMVNDQLNELTNIINGWKSALLRWHAWNLALEGFPDVMEAWEIRTEFVQPLVHECLLEPSAVRDTMIFVATNAFHQLRLASDSSYPDRLADDPTAAKPRKRFLTRPAKESQLQNLIVAFPDAPTFMSALSSLDNEDYKNRTSDYRNRSSHALGPRIEIGQVDAIAREVVTATQLIQNSQGTFDLVDVSGQMQVSYGFGGISPLSSEGARVANMAEFMKARQCYELYRRLLVSAGVESFNGS